MKTYRFATVRKDGEAYRVDCYEVMRPLSGQNVALDEVDKFLAEMCVDEIMADERGQE